MKYTITKLNNRYATEYYHIHLCPICHKHLTFIDCIGTDDTDTSFLDQPMCNNCRTRYEGHYNSSIYKGFDGFLDRVTGELIDACDFPPKDFSYVSPRVLSKLCCTAPIKAVTPTKDRTPTWFLDNTDLPF